MKYYFFRDLDHKGNTIGEMSFHAAGVVDIVYPPNESGKDFAVSYFHPFQGYMRAQWRSINEVQVFEVPEQEYKEVARRYAKIEDI